MLKFSTGLVQFQFPNTSQRTIRRTSLTCLLGSEARRSTLTTVTLGKLLPRAYLSTDPGQMIGMLWIYHCAFFPLSNTSWSLLVPIVLQHRSQLWWSNWLLNSCRKMQRNDDISQFWDQIWACKIVSIAYEYTHEAWAPYIRLEHPKKELSWANDNNKHIWESTMAQNGPVSRPTYL